MQRNTPKNQVESSCPNCWKVISHCLCEDVRQLRTKTSVLILQHPQEARNPLTTARLISLTVEGSAHRIGLSWRSLSAAVGYPAEPRNWAVLYLGALKEKVQIDADKEFQILERGKPCDLASIEGIVLLDGNWKQSKTLWWRNPWLLKLKRIVLNPSDPSLYGGLRRQPRKGCVSTLEAASETFRHLGESPEVPAALTRLFKKHLDQQTGSSFAD